MKGRRRPTYIEDRINYHLARQRARRTHEPECTCPYCLDSAKIEALLRARIEANRPAWEEIEF